MKIFAELVLYGNYLHFSKFMFSRSKKSTLIYFNTNYRTEMKLVPIIMVYYLLQFDASKIFLGVRKHGGGVSTLLYFFQFKHANFSTKS